jgi:hypothetical protein
MQRTLGGKSKNQPETTRETKTPLKLKFKKMTLARI